MRVPRRRERPPTLGTIVATSVDCRCRGVRGAPSTDATVSRSNPGGKHMSKQILLGTVSAVALLLAAQGAAQAQATSTTNTANNAASGVTVDTANEIEGFAFKRFTGALQVQQNGSVNSSASQNMAIAAFKGRNFNYGSGFSSASSTDAVTGNSTVNSTVSSAGSNAIEDSAFKDARGAVQAQQNRSINSSTGQNMDIDPVSDRGGTSTFAATATLNNTVNGNSIDSASSAQSSVAGSNTITDGAFKHAKGAFQVQQNNSISSSTQQNMAISAEDLRGGRSALPASEADATQNVGGNLALGTTISGANTINDGAFKHAAGAFQVEQSNSANSAVAQNMTVAAFDARRGSGFGGERGDDAAIASSSVTNNIAGVQPSPFTQNGDIITTPNRINDGAFKDAKGAFQVQQNASINSAVGQNMAISAVKEAGATTDSLASLATSTNSVQSNLTAESTITTDGNAVSGGAFGHAAGAFEVQQNRSANSSTGQNMRVEVESDPHGTVASSLTPSARLTDNVGGLGTNNLAIVNIDGNNSISDGAFKRAAGAFQVQQNNSANSSTQQNMSIAALTAKNGRVASLSAAAEADVNENVNFNFAGTVNTIGTNVIDDGAFKHARGAFQVQQSTSGNSGVGQNMAISAADARNFGYGGPAGGGVDDARASSTVFGNRSGFANFTASGESFVILNPPDVTIDTNNVIDDGAFKHARGAFQVQQNGSVNSSVSQNMAISAIKENGRPTDTTVGATAAATALVESNSAQLSHVDGGQNAIDAAAFKNAKGAFQVQQNRSINSSAGENMRIVAVQDPRGSLASAFSAPASVGNTDSGNSALNSNVNGVDTISGSAFKNAAGAVQVQQNNALNSSTQQNMAVTAISARDGSPFGETESEAASLSQVVSFNTATNVHVTGLNRIDDHAFANAKGAFQVQQNSSTNSAVSQNMSIVAVSTTGRR
jgi:hypothetical protein